MLVQDIFRARARAGTYWVGSRMPQKGDRVKCVDGYYHRLIVDNTYELYADPMGDGYLPITDESGKEGIWCQRRFVRAGE